MGFRLLCLRKQKTLPQAVHRPRSLAKGGVRVQLNQSVVPTLQLRRPLGVGVVMGLGCLMATKCLQEFQTSLLHLSLVREGERAQ